MHIQELQEVIYKFLWLNISYRYLIKFSSQDSCNIAEAPMWVRNCSRQVNTMEEPQILEENERMRRGNMKSEGWDIGWYEQTQCLHIYSRFTLAGGETEQLLLPFAK